MIKKKNKHSSSSFLLKRGNVGLARLLLAVYDAGPDGISTRKLLQQLGSTHHAQAFIKRAEKMGYIRREKEILRAAQVFVPCITS